MEEFELTYLPKELPKAVWNAPAKETLDIYIPTTLEHPTLRIRRSGNTHEITKKAPIADDSSHQLETTIPLSADEFADLEMLPGKRISKTRYYYEEKDVEYQVDVFREGLEGLVLVDIEFKSHAEKSAFRPPTWLLVEVTQEKFIAGGMLCGKKYGDIEKQLEAFGYKKLTLE